MAAWKWFAGAVAAWKWPAGAVAAWNKFVFELLVLVTNGRGSGGLDKYRWCQLRKGYEWQPGQHESGECGKRCERVSDLMRYKMEEDKIREMEVLLIVMGDLWNPQDLSAP